MGAEQPRCGFPMVDAEDSATCDQPDGHGPIHFDSRHDSVQWTYTACWQQHFTGRLCLLPVDHDEPGYTPEQAAAYAIDTLREERDAAVIERDRAVAAVERVRALHVSRGTWLTTHCAEDGFPLPCPTVRALDGVLDDGSPT